MAFYYNKVMNDTNNESMYDLFKGEPLVESVDSHKKCPYCRRDFSKYNMMRKQCHIEACENSLKRHDIRNHGYKIANSPKKYVQTTLDYTIKDASSTQNSKKTLSKDMKFLIQKPSTSFLTKSKSVISRNEKNLQICSCPYSKEHIKERIAGLFAVCDKNCKENANFTKEPFFSSKRLLHYEILARDFQRLTKRCSGDVTIKAKNGTLKWHKIILQMRTKIHIADLIDLSEFEKESLLAYEKYIYGGEIRHSHHLLKDLKILAKRYGPESLENYLENDFTIDEKENDNESYEVKRYNDALKLDEKIPISSTIKFDALNRDIPYDSFDETMNYVVIDAEENQHTQERRNSIDEKTKYEPMSMQNKLVNIDVSNEIVNETIISSTNENFHTSNVSDIAEKQLVTHSHSFYSSCKEMSPIQINNTSLDYEDNNIGVIVFEADDEVNNETPILEPKLEDPLQQQNSILDSNIINSPVQLYSDESFYGIIEGGYCSGDSRCETPANNVDKSIGNEEKLPIYKEEEKALVNSEMNNDVKTIYKTPDIIKTIKDNNLKKNAAVKSRKQMIEDQLTKSSQLIKYTDITPQPTYEKMSDAELHKELAKYGIGKCGKKKAIMILTKIYNQLHPTVFVDNVIESPKGRKRKAHNSAKVCLLDNHDNILPLRVKCNESNTSIDSITSSQEEEVNILEESCTEFFNSQEMNNSTEEVPTFPKGKKPKEPSEWRNLFTEFIRLPENKVTFNRMLSYSTFELPEIYQLLKLSTHPIRYISKSMLVTILDELHISFTIPNDGWETKSKKKSKRSTY